MTSSPAFYTSVCAKSAKRHGKKGERSRLLKEKLKSFIEDQENVSAKKKTSYFLKTIQVKTKEKNFKKFLPQGCNSSP